MTANVSHACLCRSMSVTSARTTRALRYRARIPRSGWAISSGDNAPVAT